tara:strand:- start:183 stop:683 length:501 start_codon:yes stop_codon:yes gene_type:complete
MANEYRLKSDGSIKTKEELIAANKNMSMPKVWGEGVYETLGVDVVFETPQPTPSGAYKKVVRNGVEQNAKDQWVQAWIEQDMFADTTVDGVTTTKAEHEEAYQATLDANAAEKNRLTRNNLLAETDWIGLSDVTMSSDWATYRQALRDVPSQSGFPHDITWPEKPE